jgi:hypothetical protein
MNHPYPFREDVSVAGVTYEAVEFEYDGMPRLEDPTKGYTVELPLVMKLLELITEGCAPAAEVHSALRRVLDNRSQISGCCFMCDISHSNHVEACARYQKQVAWFDQFESARKGQDFLIVGSIIHVADCRYDRLKRPVHPGELKDWVHGPDAKHYWFSRHDQAVAPYQFMSEAEFVEWNLEENAYKYRRKLARFCKRCNSRMPPSFRISSVDPACWNWSLDSIASCSAGGSDLDAYLDMEAWQDGRCAVCGISRPLVIDHDHDTGLIRGLLCKSCNIREAREEGIFQKYRAQNPAHMLSLNLAYGYIHERIRYRLE